MKRDGFVFYRSFFEAGKDLPDEDRLKYFDRITKYAIDGIDEPVKGLTDILFKLIKPQLDANNKKAVDGLKGGRPLKEKKPLVIKNNNQWFKKNKPNVKDNVKPNVKDNVKDNVKFYGDFVKLTLIEFEKICDDYGKDIVENKIEDMNNYCGANGKKYKDYNLALRSWLKKDNSKKPKTDEERIQFAYDIKKKGLRFIKYKEELGQDRYSKIMRGYNRKIVQDVLDK